MSEIDMGVPRARLDEIDMQLADPFNDLEPHVEGQLLHEALDLCLECMLEDNWRRYKARLERLQQSELEKKRQAMREEEN